jgi:hypothetical protein
VKSVDVDGHAQARERIDNEIDEEVSQSKQTLKRLRRLSVEAMAPAYGAPVPALPRGLGPEPSLEPVESRTEAERSLEKILDIDEEVGESKQILRRNRRLSVQAVAPAYGSAPKPKPPAQLKPEAPLGGDAKSRRLRRLSVEAIAVAESSTSEGTVSPMSPVAPVSTETGATSPRAPSLRPAVKVTADDEIDDFELALMREAEREAAPEQLAAPVPATAAGAVAAADDAMGFFSDNVANDTAGLAAARKAGSGKRGRRTSVIEMAAAEASAKGAKWMEASSNKELPEPPAGADHAPVGGGLRGLRRLRVTAQVVAAQVRA